MNEIILVSNHKMYSRTTEIMDTPISVYSTNQTINGVSINIRTNTYYILESSGSLYAFSKNKTKTLLTTREILTDISYDWLNHQLYILIQSNTTTAYSIKKIDLEHEILEEVVSGFGAITQIEVDPYNGFLFWTSKLGLHSFDLADSEKSNILILKNEDIGPFVINYIQSCLFVIFRKQNTIMSVSLDGQKVINIRNNTHTALFSDAISLLYVNELFYWSNGSVIMREDYFIDDNKYYQTIYPEIHFKVNLLISNFIDQQPIPSPRNPSKSKNHSFMSKVKHEFNAKNHHLWYEYGSDEPWIILISGLLLISLFLTMVIKYCSAKKPNIIRKLREMPQSFVLTNNVGYQRAVLFQKRDNNELIRIKRKQITLTKRLGSGAFGEVFEGNVKDIINEKVEYCVALKSLNGCTSQYVLEEFLKEAKIMNNLKHKNILRVFGVCLDNEPNFIIMELMKEGDLLSYLRKTRPTQILNRMDYMRMCIDVAEGCSYLKNMHLVHRDLAARNCLVSSSDPKEQVIKIGDFGLARKMYAHCYRKEGEALLPVRWMSPESLVDGVYTSQSDVWAFGVLLWEIMSQGHQPYPGLSNINAMYYVQHGGRLEKPINCPKALYNLMKKCWHIQPEKRPTFEFCLKFLKSYYMVLEYINKRDTQLQIIPEYLNL
ncbi:serine/threonine-protein kinase pakF-like isoform X2 [Metopolophium dirhodum]|uniref:serine/threonine-protein kinase pakF-like isoform X2 n=1 Tax=Metopolophium dirhodum TaxID=44670 RepID=UPI00298F4044|nr:serine/threonine-protein kinase pakF-like isoform X2 [Metopolophium dirhodum]